MRIEELVNYFPYDYAPPAKDASDPFAAHVEVARLPVEAASIGSSASASRARRSRRTSGRRATSCSCSTSRARWSRPNKLPLVKRVDADAASSKLDGERPRGDRRLRRQRRGWCCRAPRAATQQGHDPRARSTACRPAARPTAGRASSSPTSVAAQNFIKGGTNRVILCTDGDFNVGVTNQGDLTRLIEEKAKSGVFLTVLGFGMGNLKDSTMEKLADKGNGNYAYIDTLSEAQEGARRADERHAGHDRQGREDPGRVQPGRRSASYRLIGYENRLLAKEDFNDDKKDAGEIGAGHTVTALYEIVPVGAKGDAPAVDALKYQASPNPGRAAIEAELQAARGPGSEAPCAPAQASEPRQLHSGRDRRSAAGCEAPRSAGAVIEERLNRAPVQPTSAPSDELLTVKLRYKSPDAPLEQGTSKLLEFPVKDSGQPFANVSRDFKFASAVAAFGMILRDSQHKGNATFDAVIELAQEGAAKIAKVIAGSSSSLFAKRRRCNDVNDFA